MRKILGAAHSVSYLLSQKYRIDYYQRDYKWEAKQIQELIEDLTTRFLLDYEESHERSQVADYGQYFLGSIIISQKDNVRYIVDGQQRLTSLTLILIYLDQLKQNLEDKESVAKITDLIYSIQFGTKSFNLDVSERNPCLQLLIDGENPDTVDQTPSVQNLIHRYNDITEFFPDELREKALPYFIDWLINKVTLVEITTYSDDDAYTIFETMNDRGLSLTPTDMLKGYLLANITDDSSRARADQVWKAQVGKLRELGKEEGADCIKSWLRSQYASKIRERRTGAHPEDFDKIGTEFHRWVRDDRKRIGLQGSEDFSSFITKEFLFFSHAYEFARQKANNYDSDFGSIYFNAQNSFTLQYPLMLAPLQTSDDWKTVKRKMRLVATFIEIMLARRMWNFKAISHSTMQYRAFLIMKGIRGMESDELREDLIRRLSREGSERGDYVDFHTQRAFQLHGINGPQVHRLLARMTEYVEARSDEKYDYDKYANRSTKKGGYQIEHLWANHPERHASEFNTPSEFDAYRNRIGGLVLLPAPHNASYSDMIYSDKVVHYSKENLLACSLHPIAYENNPGFSQFLKATGLPFKPMQDFRKGDLDDRQNLYMELASLCWSPNRLKAI